MQIVIDIPEREYKVICENNYVAVCACPNLLSNAIKNGLFKLRLVYLLERLPYDLSYLDISDAKPRTISGEAYVTADNRIEVYKLGDENVINDHKAMTVYRSAGHSYLAAGSVRII